MQKDKENLLCAMISSKKLCFSAAVKLKGALVDWLKTLGYGAESHWKVVRSRLGWMENSVNPEVNRHFFRIRELRIRQRMLLNTGLTSNQDEIIWRRDLSLKSHSEDRRSGNRSCDLWIGSLACCPLHHRRS